MISSKAIYIFWAQTREPPREKEAVTNGFSTGGNKSPWLNFKLHSNREIAILLKMKWNGVQFNP